MTTTPSAERELFEAMFADRVSVARHPLSPNEYAYQNVNEYWSIWQKARFAPPALREAPVRKVSPFEWELGPEITYKHRDYPDRNSFKQLAKDPLPVWASNVQPYVDPDSQPPAVQGAPADLSDDEIGEIYESTFNAALGAARSAPKAPPLVIAFARAVLRAAAPTAVQGVPAGWKIVPVEPTENMVIDGFESAPDRMFDGENYPEEYDEMGGCQQAAFRAKRCYAAMLAAAPQLGEQND